MLCHSNPITTRSFGTTTSKVCCITNNGEHEDVHCRALLKFSKFFWCARAELSRTKSSRSDPTKTPSTSMSSLHLPWCFCWVWSAWFCPWQFCQTEACEEIGGWQSIEATFGVVINHTRQECSDYFSTTRHTARSFSKEFTDACFSKKLLHYPDIKLHGANLGPTWVLSVPDGPLVGPMNLAIRVIKLSLYQITSQLIVSTMVCPMV